MTFGILILLGSIFLGIYFINNYYCSSILPMYEELSSSQITSILQQIVDRSDINTLQQLNATKFYNHPLILEGLLI